MRIESKKPLLCGIFTRDNADTKIYDLLCINHYAIEEFDEIDTNTIQLLVKNNLCYTTIEYFTDFLKVVRQFGLQKVIFICKDPFKIEHTYINKLNNTDKN